MNKDTKSKILKITLIIFIFITFTIVAILPFKFSGTLDKIKSKHDFKQMIDDGGFLSYLIFFVIQFLQATILPIPAMVTTITGTIIFGPFVSFLISFIAIFSASLLMFFLGKKVGKKFVVWAVGKDDFEKWSTKLSKGKYTFFLMMLFPFFPDDILCLLAGATTNMTYTFFIITNLITRPVGILTTCYIASGEIIPFHGWGIPVWCLLLIFVIATLFLSFKYQNKLETLFKKKQNKILSKKL